MSLTSYVQEDTENKFSGAVKRAEDVVFAHDTKGLTTSDLHKINLAHTFAERKALCDDPAEIFSPEEADEILSNIA